MPIRIGVEGIGLRAFATDWRAAVRLAGSLLVNQGTVNASYASAMERVIEEAGPYCVVAPGLALPHAQPGPWVARSSMGVLVLASPVCFGLTRNDPVDVLIPFAATDNETHLDILAELSRLFMTPGNLGAIRQARTASEVARLLGAQEW